MKYIGSTKINNSDIFKDPCRFNAHILLKKSYGEVLVSPQINGTSIAKSPLCAWKFDTVVFFGYNFSNLEWRYILSTVVVFSNKNNQNQIQLLYCCCTIWKSWTLHSITAVTFLSLQATEHLEFLVSEGTEVKNFKLRATRTLNKKTLKNCCWFMIDVTLLTSPSGPWLWLIVCWLYVNNIVPI